MSSIEQKVGNKSTLKSFVKNISICFFKGVKGVQIICSQQRHEESENPLIYVESSLKILDISNTDDGLIVRIHE